MAWWKVKTYYKKSCEQIETFTHADYSNIYVHDGFRYAEFDVETNDDLPPEFNWTFFPEVDGKKDSVNLFDCFGDNVESTELVEMFDGGCWGDIDFPEDMPEEEQDRLRELISEEGTYALEDTESWSLDETECWAWGPLEVCDENGERVRLVVADEEGNTVDFKDED
jgi:hypothetical protein